MAPSHSSSRLFCSSLDSWPPQLPLPSSSHWESGRGDPLCLNVTRTAHTAPSLVSHRSTPPWPLSTPTVTMASTSPPVVIRPSATSVSVASPSSQLTTLKPSIVGLGPQFLQYSLAPLPYQSSPSLLSTIAYPTR